MFLIYSVRATCAAYLVLNLIHLIIFGRGTHQSAPPCAVQSTALVTDDRVTELPGTANTVTAQQIALSYPLLFVTVFTKIKPFYPTLSYFSQLHMQIIRDVAERGSCLDVCRQCGKVAVLRDNINETHRVRPTLSCLYVRIELCP